MTTRTYVNESETDERERLRAQRERIAKIYGHGATASTPAVVEESRREEADRAY